MSSNFRVPAAAESRTMNSRRDVLTLKGGLTVELLIPESFTNEALDIFRRWIEFEVTKISLETACNPSEDSRHNEGSQNRPESL